jgi:hypothetical protein
MPRIVVLTVAHLQDDSELDQIRQRRMQELMAKQAAAVRPMLRSVRLQQGREPGRRRVPEQVGVACLWVGAWEERIQSSKRRSAGRSSPRLGEACIVQAATGHLLQSR